MELTSIGKLFFGGLLAWIAKDAKFHFKIKGTPEQLQAMAKAVFASKRFTQELAKPNATIESVLEKLNLKHISAQDFKEMTGRDFPF